MQFVKKSMFASRMEHMFVKSQIFIDDVLCTLKKSHTAFQGNLNKWNHLFIEKTFMRDLTRSLLLMNNLENQI